MLGQLDPEVNVGPISFPHDDQVAEDRKMWQLYRLLSSLPLFLLSLDIQFEGKCD